MEKRRLNLNRTGGAKNYNSPLRGGPYSAHPVHYNMIENIHLDLDAMDNEIDKALNSTSTKVRQVAHNFTVLQSIYFNTDTEKWVLAQADDKDTIGTHIVVEVIDKDYFVAGLSGIFEVKNTLDLGYWFTSDTVAGELVDTAPDINNPMIQVIDSNTIRVLDMGIVDNLDSISANNVIVTNPVTPDYTAALQGNNLQQVTNKVAGLQEGLSKLDRTLIAEFIAPDNITGVTLDKDTLGNDMAIPSNRRFYIVLDLEFVSVSDEVTPIDGTPYLRFNGINSSVYYHQISSKGTFMYLGGTSVLRQFHKAELWCDFTYDSKLHGVQHYHGINVAGSIINNINTFFVDQAMGSLTSLFVGSANTANYLLKAGSKIQVYV